MIHEYYVRSNKPTKNSLSGFSGLLLWVEIADYDAEQIWIYFDNIY
jgi:hypothetical protein